MHAIGWILRNVVTALGVGCRTCRRTRMIKQSCIAVFITALTGLAHANLVESYSVSDAKFTDGQTLSGTWTVDWTTNTVLSLNMSTHGLTFTNPGAVQSFPLHPSGQVFLIRSPFGPLPLDFDYSSLGSQYYSDARRFAPQTSPVPVAIMSFSFFRDSGVLFPTGGSSTGDFTIGQADSQGAVVWQTLLSDSGTPAAVPLPAAFPLMVGGLSMLGIAMRRRVATA